jgi:hypothetical protein
MLVLRETSTRISVILPIIVSACSAIQRMSHIQAKRKNDKHTVIGERAATQAPLVHASRLAEITSLHWYHGEMCSYAAEFKEVEAIVAGHGKEGRVRSLRGIGCNFVEPGKISAVSWVPDCQMTNQVWVV